MIGDCGGAGGRFELEGIFKPANVLLYHHLSKESYVVLHLLANIISLSVSCMQITTADLIAKLGRLYDWTTDIVASPSGSLGCILKQ